MPKIRIKRGTTSQWNSSTTPLLGGELGYDTVTKTIKIGDGTTLWNSLLPLNKYEIDEISQDAIYGALTDFVSTGSNITVTYNDEGNYIVLDTGPDVVLATDLSTAIQGANDYTDTAVAGLGNSIDGQYVPVGDVGNVDGVAPLDENALIPDSYIPANIARDSEIVTDYNNLSGTPSLFSGNYNDLTNRPNIALGAVKWTANHWLLPGGENTRYLAGDIVWDGGSIFVANYDNESLPTNNTLYWTNIGAGKRLNIDGRDIPNILWDNILQKPTLFDGDYESLTSKPTIFDGAYSSLTGLPTLFSGSYDDLTSKPTLFSGSYNDLTSKPTIPDLTGYATETYVGTAISNLIDGAGPALDTLNELAAAINDDASFASTVTTELGTKAPIASPTFTGTVTLPSNTSGANLTNIPNSALVNSSITINGTPVSLGGSTTISTSDSTKLNITDPAIDYYVTNAGMGSYMVNGVSNGLIIFERGKKHRIHVNAPGHPFWIQTVSGGYSSGNVYSTGITNNGTAVGHIIVEFPQNAPDDLYYVCQYHPSMQGSISVQSQSTLTINSKSSSYTILPIDAGRLIEMSSGGTLTIIDSSSFPIGYSVDILQTGSSQVTIAGDGFIPNATPGLKLRTQWSSATLIKRGLNSWVVLGDLSA